MALTSRVHVQAGALDAERYRHDAVLVSDLRHFLDLPVDAPTPARRLAEHLTSVVRAATTRDPGTSWVGALRCRRRPGHRACPGFIAVLRTEIPSSIEWRCMSCGDEGVINGWERSPFDLRADSTEDESADLVRTVITAEIAATLQSLMLVDAACERLIFSSSVVDSRIVLTGHIDDLDELTGYVAAEANHEPDRRRQKRLDVAFDALTAAAQHAQRPG